MDVYRQGSEVVVDRARLSRLPSAQTTRTVSGPAPPPPPPPGGSRGECGHRRGTVLPPQQSGQSAINRCTIHRFLLIFIVLSQLCVCPVPVSADNTYTPNVVRTYSLQARCSAKQVQIVSNKVKANAKYMTDYTVLNVESIGTKVNNSYHVRLQSVKYKTYICFNRRGGLRVMQYGHHKGCRFTEELSEDYFTKYRLATRQGWYIGFRKNGRPIKGTARQRRSECYQFIKIDLERNRSPGHGPLGSMTAQQRVKFLQKASQSRQQQKRQRRQRHQRMRSRRQRPDQT